MMIYSLSQLATRPYHNFDSVTVDISAAITVKNLLFACCIVSVMPETDIKSQALYSQKSEVFKQKFTYFCETLDPTYAHTHAHIHTYSSIYIYIGLHIYVED
jgi:hypothetical protein